MTDHPAGFVAGAGAVVPTRNDGVIDEGALRSFHMRNLTLTSRGGTMADHLVGFVAGAGAGGLTENDAAIDEGALRTSTMVLLLYLVEMRRKSSHL